MIKIVPAKPLLIMLYGYPGSGKTYLSRQLCERISAAHLQADRIRGELFENPKYSRQENGIVEQLMNYMGSEFLKAGVSIIYDTNAMRVSQRRSLRDMAKAAKAIPVLIWFQMDGELAFNRSRVRKPIRADDKYSRVYQPNEFKEVLGHMQNPEMGEDYVVISGRHTFNTQLSAIIKKLYALNLIKAQDTAQNLVKPELVNLVPSQGINNGGRHNILLR